MSEQMGLPERSHGWILHEREWARFTWPISSVDDFVRLLACAHGAPTGVVAGEFTASIRTAQAREGRIFISVDRRACPSGGLHCTCDFFAVLHLHTWPDGLFGFVPCVHQLARDDCLSFKIADGRTFIGILAFIYVYSISAGVTFMEQPDTIIPDCLLPATVTFSPEECGDPFRKTIVAFIRGSPPPWFDPSVRVTGVFAGKRLSDFASADERDRWRSSWLRYPATCRLLAQSVRPHSPPPPPLDFRVLAELFSVRWYLRGRSVPDWYSWVLGSPPPHDPAYQLVRGPGDGRGVDAVVPLSLRIPPCLPVSHLPQPLPDPVGATRSDLMVALQKRDSFADPLAYLEVWGLLLTIAWQIHATLLVLLAGEALEAQLLAWTCHGPPSWVAAHSLEPAAAPPGPTAPTVTVGSLRRRDGKSRPRLPSSPRITDWLADRRTVLGCPFPLERDASLSRRAEICDLYRLWLEALLWAGGADFDAEPQVAEETLAHRFGRQHHLSVAPAWDSTSGLFRHTDRDVAAAVYSLVAHLDTVGDVRLLCWCQDPGNRAPLRCHCCELATVTLRLVTARRAARAPAPMLPEMGLPVTVPAMDLERGFAPESVLAVQHVAGLTSASLLVVFVCCLSQPLVYAHVNGYSVLGAALPAGASVTVTAQRLVQAAALTTTLVVPVGQYLRGPAVVAVPLAADPLPAHVVRSKTRRLSLAAAGFGFVWCTLAALSSTLVADPASRSVLGVTAFSGAIPFLADEWVGDAPSSSGGFISGRMPATPLTPLEPFGGVFQAEGQAVEASFRSGRWLQEALTAATGEWASDLYHLADRISPPDFSAIPSDLLSNLPSFAGQTRIDALPFTPVYKPLTTTWLPRQPPFPPRPTSTCRTHFLDFMPPSAKRNQVEQWLRDSLQDLMDISEYGANVERRRPATVVVSQLDLYPEVRGVVWDCTLERSTCCEVLDTQQDIATHLNRDYLRTRLRRYPDQRLVSNILLGIRLEADIELNAVLMPHLVSLPLGFASVDRELRRMHGLHWYRFYGTFPYWPIICNGQGCTSRKLEPDRYRRTTEAGGPRAELWDRAGARVLSLNMASRLYYLPSHFAVDTRIEMIRWLGRKGLPAPTEVASLPLEVQLRTSKFHKEVKPTLAMMMHDIMVLARAAHLLGEPIYVFSDDAKDYFNQLAIAREDLWKLGIVFLGVAADLSTPPTVADGKAALIIISELRLGFGCHMASNMAQRFSEAIMVMFREDMDAADAAFICADCDPRPSFAQWREGRIRAAAVARPPTAADVQLRLYAVHIFTDDPAFVVVGVQRALRLLRVWRALVSRIGLIMAIAEKRVLGVWAPWLGTVLLPQLGLVVITQDKLLRAAKTLSECIAGTVTFDVYRSLVGLLEHFRGIYQIGRQAMHGLYEPHDPVHGAASHGPAAVIHPSVLMLKQLRSWLKRIRTGGGVSVLASERRDRGGRSSAGLTVCLSADAANDDEAAGMGGFCHGFYWHISLPIEAVLYLHITALEFLAMAISIIVFTPIVSHFSRVVLHSDALATPFRLTRGRGSSPTLQFAHYLLRLTDEFQKLAPMAEVAHLGGDKNVLADAVSRAMWSTLRQLAIQIRIRLTELEVPVAARLLLERVLAFEMRRLQQPRAPPARRRLASARRERAHQASSGSVPLLATDAPERVDQHRLADADSRRLVQLDGERVHPHPGMATAQLRLAMRLHEACGGDDQLDRSYGALTASQARLAHRLHGVSLPLGGAIPPLQPSPPLLQSADVIDDAASPPCLPSSHSRLAVRLHSTTHTGAPEAPMIGVVSVTTERGVVRLPAPPQRVRRQRDSRLGQAHRRHVSARADRLSADTSAGAIRAGVEVLSALLAASADLEDYGINFSTFAKDECAWASWELFCEDVLETPAIRTVAMTAHDPERETEILGLFVLWIYPQIVPRDRSHRWASPRSAFAKALAIIRVHGRWGVILPGAKAVRAKLNGLLRSFVVSYGPHALVPNRKEPWLRSMTVSVSELPERQLPNGTFWSPRSHIGVTVVALMCFLLETGFRLGEIVQHPSGEVMYLTRSCLVWYFDGVPTACPTRAQLLAIRIGTRVDVRPSRSKSDQWGELHCPYTMTLVCGSDSALDTVRQLAGVELMQPAGEGQRETAPLFATVTGVPFTHGFLDRLLLGLLLVILGARARLYSWHSFRVGLACALRAVGCPPDVTQLICRWMSPASLRVYALKGVAEHTSWLIRARVATVDAVRSVQPPVVDVSEGLSIAGAQFRERGAWHEATAGAGVPPLAPAAPLSHPPIAAVNALAAPPRHAALRVQWAVGDRLLLPRELWPGDVCLECDGRGWAAHVVSVTSRSVVVSFVSARTANGSPFADLRLPRSAVLPLS